MKLYRVVRKAIGSEEWEPVPGNGIYKSERIAKGQRTRMESNQWVPMGRPGYYFDIQCTDTEWHTG